MVPPAFSDEPGAGETLEDASGATGAGVMGAGAMDSGAMGSGVMGVGAEVCGTLDGVAGSSFLLQALSAIVITDAIIKVLLII